ncbi:Stabilin-2 [Cricetulus griseus]|uniref:Stabilin-2 n=1 Tax=Cricetulus griseus TaxID=10029 RepID=G3HQN1_CRIGR|nr:Stabilin-2 [Cricetulus griseus]
MILPLIPLFLGFLVQNTCSPAEASGQAKRCDKKSFLTIWTECQACSTNFAAKCPDGYVKITNGSVGVRDCRRALVEQPVKPVLLTMFLGPIVHQSHCECREHYSDFVPGVGCSMINVCESKNPCHKNANCSTVAPGQTQCTCQKGYTGDGLTCYGNIMERLRELNTEPRGMWQGRLTTFISILDRTYGWPLRNLGPFTVLLPSDKGLKGFDVKELLMDNEAARYFVKLHIIGGQMSTEQMNDTDTFYTLTGKSGEIFNRDKDNQLKLKLHGGKMVKIIQGDIVASNGLIHVLDRAMDKIEPTLLSNPQGSRKLLELVRYHIVAFIQLEVTTLISTSHIRSMANQIIQFNISQNGQILANDVAVQETGIVAKNGRIYTLAGVLVPPSIIPIIPHRCDETKKEMIPALFTHKCVYSSRTRNMKSGCARYCNATIKCRDGLSGNGTCICDDGFQGSKCQFCSNPNRYGPRCNKTCLCAHGACDNRVDSDGACLSGTCREGTAGKFCNKQTSTCGPYVYFCHIHATCKYYNGTASCVCNEGYEGDGTLCSKKDPCMGSTSRGGCSQNAECIPTGPGTHICVCQQGWTGDGRDCVEINNCLLPGTGGCHDNATCLYLGPGQASCQFASSGVWSCVCQEGYEGNGLLCYGNVFMNASLQSMLSATLNFTVLVPSQQAIEDMDQNEKTFWLSWNNIPALIKYHTLLGTYGVSDLQTLSSSHRLATSLQGSFLHLDKANGNITIEGASIVDGDNAATNGVIHIINKQYNLANAIEAADTYTVFAPNNEAIENYIREKKVTTLEEDILRYHVILGEKLLKNDLHNGMHRETMMGFSYLLGFFLHNDQLYVNEVPINYTNVATDKGVIHGLGKVLEIQKNRCDKNDTTIVRTRACCAGFFGPQCQACPGKGQNVCSGNGFCLDGVNGTGTCECEQGFNGTACETCTEGKYGVHCDQEINPCLENNGGCDRNAECTQTGPNQAVCNCLPKYTGDGKTCTLINVCLTNNGGCSPLAICTHTGQDQRICTCKQNYTGDGFTCRGSIYGELPKNPTTSQYFFQLQQHAVRELTGPGPFTVFAPSSASFNQEPRIKDWDQQGLMSQILRYHVVACQQLLLEDLKVTTNAMTLQGEPISISVSQDTIYINNKAKVLSSDIISTNGVIHIIDKLLSPQHLLVTPKDASGRVLQNLTTVAMNNGYTRFSKLIQDSGLLSVITDHIHIPVTLFWPTDKALQALPLEQQNFLFHQDNKDMLKEYLKFHVIRDTRGLKQRCLYSPVPFGRSLEGCQQLCTLVIPIPRCCKGYFLPHCQACGCSEHGQCDEGITGSGQCLCEAGWTGRFCDTLTVVDFCKQNNGGCAKVAKCSQKGTQVSCSCQKGYQGDGHSCTEIDPCADGVNGGCHEHATCRMTGPGRHKCECKSHYVGDGLDCEPEQLPLDRCLQDNGQCHPDASCADLHFQDTTVGVFHLRSPLGQYKLTFDKAKEACANEAASMATYNQLSYAQKASYHLCSAGWLENGRVGYPTTYASPKCGSNIVGIVDYGIRPNKSEMWDVFCYRMKDVNCTCKAGYVGDGFSCNGNLLQVLMSLSSLTNFLEEVLAYSNSSARGQAFLKHLTDLSIRGTLFVPQNSGLLENKTLSGRDIEHHLTNVSVSFYNDLVNGTVLRTRLGSQLLITSSQDQLHQETRFVDGRAILQWDIIASNGLIHIISEPLEAPPMTATPAHTGLGTGIVCAVILVTGAIGLAVYSYFRLNQRTIGFRHFESEEDINVLAFGKQQAENISNPVYESSMPAPPETSGDPFTDSEEQEEESSDPLGAQRS